MALGLLVASPSPAQFGAQTGFVEAFKPDYFARDIQFFNEYLELEEWQRPIIETLLEDYTASFQAGMDAMRDQMTSRREDLANKGAAGIMPIIEAWGREKNQLKQEFIANVQSQLSEAQIARWPRFERAFRREKSLHLGELSGENVNILAILRDISIDSGSLAAIEPIVAGYELELDEALQAREAMMASQQSKIQEAMISGDTNAGVAAVERIVVTRVRVRDVNDRAAEAIAAALPDKARGEFLNRWRSNAYSRAFRPSAVDRIFAAAEALPDLTDSQRSGLASIRAAFDQENEALAMQALNVLRSEEPKDARRKAEAGRASSKERPTNRPPDLLASVNQQRDQLNERTQKQIEDLLGPELSAQLPGLSKGRAAVDGPRGRERDGGSSRERRVAPGAGRDAGGLDHGTGHGSKAAD